MKEWEPRESRNKNCTKGKARKGTESSERNRAPIKGKISCEVLLEERFDTRRTIRLRILFVRATFLSYLVSLDLMFYLMCYSSFS